MSDFTNVVPMLITAVGLLAFVVSVVVEVIKGIGALKAVPTDLVVILLSIVFTLLAVIIYASMNAIALLWYYYAVSVIAGFFVAFVAMYGWEKFNDMHSRFKK